ncbi:MAG: hypothetical protein V9E98_00210 [Candidatus Nanopelagicales bacterium]
MVVRHKARRLLIMVAKSLDSLQQVDARLLGTVLNFAPTKRRGDEYGYGYGGYAQPARQAKPDDRPKEADGSTAAEALSQTRGRQ